MTSGGYRANATSAAASTPRDAAGAIRRTVANASRTASGRGSVSTIATR